MAGPGVDTKRKLLIGTGRPGRDLRYRSGQLQTAGDQGPRWRRVAKRGERAGWDYDPVADRMVGWASGRRRKSICSMSTQEMGSPSAGKRPEGHILFAHNGVFGAL